jgi:hypothetical protein
MKKNLVILMILSLILGVSIIYAADKKMIYGKKHAFKVEALENWTEDKDVMGKTGIPFFIRPNDEMDRKNVYLYALGFDRLDNNKKTMEDFIQGNIKDYQSQYPGIKMQDLDITFHSLQKTDLLSGRYAVIESSDFDTTYKEIAVYIDFPLGVIMLVYSTKTPESYQKYYPDFIAFVESFELLGNSR